MNHGLTIQAMVRNEPFVYYAIKSVYDYADSILIYDTGSTDHTLEDIELLLKEDTYDKIRFQKVTMDVDETTYSQKTLKQHQAANEGKRNKVDIRNEMIADTDTEFFMLVDGDEVHYRGAINKIRNQIIPLFPEDKICGLIPEIWFYDLTHTFKMYSPVGRIFRTDKVVVGGRSPDERHISKDTGRVVTGRSQGSIYFDVKPYAHFMKYLKPWRHEVYETKEFKGELPEVMLENDYFIKRFDEQHGP